MQEEEGVRVQVGEGKGESERGTTVEGGEREKRERRIDEEM